MSSRVLLFVVVYFSILIYFYSKINRYYYTLFKRSKCFLSTKFDIHAILRNESRWLVPYDLLKSWTKRLLLKQDEQACTVLKNRFRRGKSHRVSVLKINCLLEFGCVHGSSSFIHSRYNTSTEYICICTFVTFTRVMRK